MEDLTARLRAARHVLVMTGAGVSAASGVPTFRGAQGLWKQFRAEQLATPEAFAQDPKTVWEWYDWRRQQIAAARPNAAHDVLARWASRFPAFTLVTQNVDGLHERAGSAHVHRYHGSIWQLRCTGTCRDEWEDLRAPLPDFPPHCPTCDAPARPGVVWFGELINEAAARAASRAAASCDVFVAIGTSAQVYPAALHLHEAKAHGAFTVEINPEATSASDDVDLALRHAAEIILPAIDAAL